MGEALISRSTTIPDEILNPIDPVAGYCVLVVKVKDADNRPITNLKITCNAAGQLLNYVTNERGATLFTINSGTANVFLNNYLNNGVRVCDYNSRWENDIAAPIGTVQNKNFILDKSTFGRIISNSNCTFISANNVILNMSGGGGGGGGGSGWGRYGQATGGAGGRGYTNNISVEINKNYVYRAIVGAGGAAGGGLGWGSGVSDDEVGSPLIGRTGNSGGTTSFINISAAGGGGGYGGGFSSGRPVTGSTGSGGNGARGGTGGYGLNKGTKGASGWINYTLNF